MDIILALLPWKILWGLQMRKKEKIGVAIAMSMGIFAGITSFIKTSKLTVLENVDRGMLGPLLTGIHLRRGPLTRLTRWYHRAQHLVVCRVHSDDNGSLHPGTPRARA